jgi:hypothetical protein
MLTTFCFALRHCAREPGLAHFFPPAAAEFPFQTPAGAAARAAERDALGARHRPAPSPPLVRPCGPEGVRQQSPLLAPRAWPQAPVGAAVRAAKRKAPSTLATACEDWFPRGLGHALGRLTGRLPMCLVMPRSKDALSWACRPCAAHVCAWLQRRPVALRPSLLPDQLAAEEA